MFKNCCFVNLRPCPHTTAFSKVWVSLLLQHIHWFASTLSFWCAFDCPYYILGDPGAVSRAGEKARRKFSSTGGKAPGYRLSPDHFQAVKRMLAPDWAQKMLCIIVPNRRTASPEFFSWDRTGRLLTGSRLVWLLHQRNARSQETFTLIYSPFQNTVYPKTKGAFFKNTSLSLQQVFTLSSIAPS